ncbi:hypothetical protein FKW77_007851 [Venturia effusa]|uniref:Mid2 domain-containing protein n=1 Tax=Venturia effusa TaxID=50376 RepID=A0A517LLW2_9PEZI|nr:hypothetical protein FKW77_007851 [Venturia effusa]
MSTNGTAPSTPPLTSTPSTTSLPTNDTPPATPATTPTPTTSAPTTTPSPTPPTNTVPPVTSVVTAPSAPPTTQLVTSTVAANTSNGSVVPASTVVVTVVSTPTTTPFNDTTVSQTSGAVSPSSTSTSSAALNAQGRPSGKSGGLTPAGTIAIAVVIPIVVIAALVFAGLFLWRRRKQQQDAEEERRKEMEAYGFNPNNDPTLPAVGGGGSEMMEDDSGYRGWGKATTVSNRKASTALSSGLHPSSDAGHHSPGSLNASDQHSGDPLVAGGARRSTMDSETIGALGTAPAATENIRRGPSNASSSYSMGAHSNGSADASMPVGGNDYYTDNMYYGNHPYDAPGQGQEAVIRDNPARRNTQIQRSNIYPQQGSSGIAQNF